jgi:hypothetical protein
MIRYAILGLAFMVPISAPARGQDAKVLAQDILDKGAALFDKKDAGAMAATYVEDAELSLIDKDQSTGTYKSQVTRGRDAIERFYEKIFADRKEGAKARNVVESAYLIGSDLMVIHGRFAPDADSGGRYPFIQVRTKRNDRWLIMNLQLFIVSAP